LKCDICQAYKAMKCTKCNMLVCRNHYSQHFDEETRKLVLLCHNCSRDQMTFTYTPRRRWRRRRYYWLFL